MHLSDITLIGREEAVAQKYKKTMIYIDAIRSKERDGEPNAHKLIQCIWESQSDSFGDFNFAYHKYIEMSGLKLFFENYDEDAAIIYISSHGTQKGLNLESECGCGDCTMTWRELSLIICESDSLVEETCLFLGSCLGGFKRGALQIMSDCFFINNVSGLPCELVMRREALAFHVFCSHLDRKSDARRIENAVTIAIEQQFNVFVRSEMDVEIALYTAGYDENFFPDLPEEKSHQHRIRQHAGGVRNKPITKRRWYKYWR